MFPIVTFIPLYGTTEDEPLCYILQIDQFFFLLNCGWDDAMDVSLLEPIKKYVPLIDAILITHPDIPHLGALPYVIGKMGVKAPIYCTLPVCKMGQMFMYEAWIARSNSSNFSTFSLDDVDLVYENMEKHQLKYSQHRKLTDKGLGITITPYCAGHMLGGAFWKIQKESDEIVFAVDFNHRNERHLNRTVLETINSRPRVLITDSEHSADPITKTIRDAQFFDAIMNCLMSGGNVLLPTGTAGRSLELLLCLDQYWEANNITKFSLCFVTYQAFHTLKFARSQLEWMSDSITKDFDTSRSNPFSLKHFQICQSKEELEMVPGPKVALISPSSLETGISREIFIKWANNPLNLVILTQKTPQNTLSSLLLKKKQESQNSSFIITLQVHEKRKLEGTELQRFREKEKAQLELKAQQQREQEQRDAVEAEADALKKMQTPHTITEQEFDEFVAVAVASNATARATNSSLVSMHERMFPVKKKRKVDFSLYGWEIAKNDPIIEYSISQNFDMDGNSMLPSENSKIPGNPKFGKKDEKIPGIDSSPSKFVSYPLKLEVQCGVIYVDFEGKSDSGSMKTIVSKLNPHKMVLVHGSQKSKEQFAQYIKSNVTQDVFTPEKGQSVNVTSEVNVHRVTLSDAVLSSLKYCQVKDYRIAFVSGVVDTNESVPEFVSEVNSNQNNNGDKSDERLSSSGNSEDNNVIITEEKVRKSKPKSLAILREGRGEQLAHKVSYIGEIKLVDLKEELEKKGFQAIMREKALLCNGQITIRKVSNQVKIEGALSPLYYKIRQILYSEFKII